LHTFNFESTQHADRTLGENAKELVALFRESCRHRADPTKTNVVSLSGGLDSRAVAAGLHEEGIPFFAATFLQYGRRSSSDMDIAALLARSYKWEWQPYALDPPLGRHYLRLLRIKNGLNCLGMSFILPFFEQIREKYPRNVTYFTGDGGDKVLPDLRPTKHFDRLEELADFILHMHRISSLKTVALLTQLDDSEIKQGLLASLTSYPERDLAQKYVHFMLYERAMKWAFEGEDRNRFYFWSAAPFYAIRFFSYAMNCPSDQKHLYLLYRHFLRSLSGPAAEVLEARGWFPPASGLYGLKRIAKSFLAERVPSAMKFELERLMFHSYDPQSAIVSCLRSQLENNEAITVHLSRGVLNKIIENCQNHSKLELENLFSVTSQIEDLEGKRSSIEQYLDTRFL
jgi:asparagine synthase (glutamine-hydrolysing)